MKSWVCVDAGILIKLVVPEDQSNLTFALWEQWQKANLELIAPSLFWFEIVAVLRKKVYRNLLTRAEGEQALTAALNAKDAAP